MMMGSVGTSEVGLIEVDHDVCKRQDVYLNVILNYGCSRMKKKTIDDS